MSCRKSCDRYAERRAGDVIETDLVAERDRLWFATMFAADSALEAGARGAPVRDRHSNEFTDTAPVKEICLAHLVKTLAPIRRCDNKTAVGVQAL